MEENNNLESYVVSHFEEALKKGWIRVYYQPVVRTLSGKLCSMEALCRWMDPEKGILSPAVVIPALEKAKLIYKLDAYVLDQVGQRLRSQMVSLQPMVPISFNLSRLDFVMTDPLALVEDVVQKYHLMRDYLCIEITETTMVQDVPAMTRQLQRLHKSGYKIWLDDFGSGYSSLNVLHNYHFDELKIDMAFLQNLNEKGRKIIVSVVLMAKALGVHTLAEGVETLDQLNFLKSIGCEKIQGFYYSAPLPYEKWILRQKELGLGTENRLEENCYDRAGLVNVITDEPVAICRFDHGNLAILLANRQYEKALKSVGIASLEQANKNFADPDYPLRELSRAFIQNTIRSRKPQTIFYTENGQYLRNYARLLSGSDGLYLVQSGLQNITSNQKQETASELDIIFRKMVSCYDGIVEIIPAKDRVRVLETVNEAVKNWEQELSIPDFTHKYADIFVHPGDRDRFLRFMQPVSLQQQALSSGRGEAQDLFRIKRRDGNYRWMIFHAIVSFRDDPLQPILLGVREDLWERKNKAERKHLLPLLGESFGLSEGEEKNQPLSLQAKILLWENLADMSPLKLFWKDKKGRYLGASQAFLDFYGISFGQIHHKTDEEIGWDLDAQPIREKEQEILKSGRVCLHIFDKTLAKGVLHSVRIAWFPIYKEKNIVGSMGIVEDLETEEKEKSPFHFGLRDPETGYLSYRGALEAGMQYMKACRLHGEDCTAMLLSVPEYTRIYRTLGKEAAKDVLRQVTACFAKLPLYETALAHLGVCRFLLFTKETDKQKIDENLRQLSEDIHGITQAGGFACTLYLQYGVARGSEAQRLEVLLSLLMERLRTAEQQRYGQSIYIGDRIVFDREKFDTMDEQVVITDPVTYEIIYMNKRAEQSFGFQKADDYRGKKCYQMLEGHNAPCSYCHNALLRQDRFHSWTHRCIKNGQDLLLRDTLVPWRGRSLRFSLSINLNQYVNMDIATNAQIYQEASINDIITVGMQEEDVNTGIRNMLAKLGRTLKAERCYIFEKNPDGTVSATYAWRRDGTEPHKGSLQNLPLKDFQPLYNAFNRDQIALLPSVADYKKQHPDFSLPLPGVKRFIAGHLVLASHSQGFTAVVNPAPEAFRSMGLLLATLTRFFSILLRNRDKQSSLEHFSLTDALTGMGNRYALQKYLGTIPDGTPLTFVYGDINNLKKENDTHGHEAGDHLIQKAAEILAGHRNGGQVFRMGGDEFLLILKGGGSQKARAVLQALQEDFRRQHVGMALGLVSAAAPLEDLDTVLMEADKKMYADKKNGRT